MLVAHSALVSSIGCNFDSFDSAHFAQQLGLSIHDLGEVSSVAEALAGAPESGVLFLGTGSITFDARLAAALGVPMFVLSGAGVREDLVREEVEKIGAYLAAFFTEETAGSQTLPTQEFEPVISAEIFEAWLLRQAKTKQAHIVLPEGDDDRILIAADKLLSKGICQLTILGVPEQIQARAAELELDISAAVLKDPATDPQREEFAQQFAQLRKAKGVTVEQARETMADISYYATMMVHNGLADGMVSGAAHTTAHTIKPSFQIIKTKPEASVVSSIFLMVMQGKLWAFGDCAVNPNPTPEQLAEMAVVSARTAAQFGLDPKVAMLSYSTGTSGSGPDVDRVAQAVARAQELDGSVAVDGPLQFDAAVVASVAQKKMPNSSVAGQANVFIFPDLDAGNITYKAVQRSAGALAVGPILQGLNKPVNDLSRGATVDDIVNTVAVTAIQAKEQA
ncbi:phosphate acetyltransferase [Corynebacterium sp. sy039]|uniref:phosphate acetyltransferase n=1 Tax=Corynebacterium sp. sy039 TaxID=2599641 RepID=UPI00352FAB79